jgi:hypothetical protein
MKLTTKQIYILKALAAGDWIKANWQARSSRGGFYLARDGESVNKRTYKILQEKKLISGVAITPLGKRIAKTI